MSTRIRSRVGPRVMVGGALLALGCLTGCSGLGGKVSGGRYSEPSGLFSVAVPDLTAGLRIEDGQGKTDGGMRTGAVSFHDDFGHVRAIQYEQVPSEKSQQFSDPARATELLQGCVHGVTLLNIQSACPGASILREEAVSLPDGLGAWFAVIEIPGGSTMSVMDSEHPEGKRLDSTRGYLLLCRNDMILVLSAANDLGRVLGGAGATPASYTPGAGDELKDTLTKLYASMSFG
jgi:hypothetical protein